MLLTYKYCYNYKGTKYKPKYHSFAICFMPNFVSQYYLPLFKSSLLLYKKIGQDFSSDKVLFKILPTIIQYLSVCF